MRISIRRPLCFSEIGRKDNQEDYLWPLPQGVSANDRIFLMCDGVGGQDSGEVASQTAATALGTYLKEHMPEDGVLTKAVFEEALAYAYDMLDSADTSDAGAQRKMGTTMTCLVLHAGGAMMAHIGDSRIYQIRPLLADSNGRTGIIYQSTDHSLVNDLLRAGEITEEEAAHFPQKNVITRAMQPHLERRCRADVYNTTDVQAGDYFFLCCDGVLEQLTNDMLGAILANGALDDQGKIKAIKEVCDGKTRDNYTCWLIPVDQVEGIPVLAEDEETVDAVVEKDSDAEEIPQPVGRAPHAAASRKPGESRARTTPEKIRTKRHACHVGRNFLVKALMGLLLCMCMIAAGVYVGRFFPSGADKVAPDTCVQTKPCEDSSATDAPQAEDTAKTHIEKTDSAEGKAGKSQDADGRQEGQKEEGNVKTTPELKTVVDSVSKAFSKGKK